MRRVYLDKEQILKAEEFLSKNAARGYSYVDCLSFCLMRQLKLVNVFTSDNHFAEQGFRVMLSP